MEQSDARKPPVDRQFESDCFGGECVIASVPPKSRTVLQVKSRSQHAIDVFNVCVNRLRIGAPQAIDALTSTGYTKPESRERLQKIGDLITERVPQVSASAIADFIERNSVTQPVTNIYPIDDRFVPITHAEMNVMFGGDIGLGWDKFRARYPDSRGTLSISDIGFDDSYAQAILCIGQQVRTSSEWSVLADVPAWRS